MQAGRRHGQDMSDVWSDVAVCQREQSKQLEAFSVSAIIAQTPNTPQSSKVGIQGVIRKGNKCIRA
jgi:hypothetical protein